MFNNIYCLMVSNVSLNGTMSRLLLDTAYQMLENDCNRKAFKNDEIEGVITTSFTSRTLFGGITGKEFSAEIESSFGRGLVKFLVRDADVEIRKRLTCIPLEEMFGNQPPSRYAPVLN